MFFPSRRAAQGILLALFVLGGCRAVAPTSSPVLPPDAAVLADASAPATSEATQPHFTTPVTLWARGKTAGQVDAVNARAHAQVVLDLGEGWVPYIFSEPQAAPPLTQSYRSTYLALARGEFPNDHHGLRAKKDRYLELYGILPSLALLRTRFREAVRLDCGAKVDLAPLEQFERMIAYSDNTRSRREAVSFAALEARIRKITAKYGFADASQLDPAQLSVPEKAALKQYGKSAPNALVVRTVQARLACEGFFDGKSKYTDAALDWPTSEAVAAFERKHRVFGYGHLGKDTVRALKTPPLEGERETIIRVLTERALHAAGFLEDGSTSGPPDKPRTFRGKDGREHPIPNLERDLRASLIEAFGLQTPESTLAWLESLGDLGGEHPVAIAGPAVPEYHAPDMALSVVIDRGDIWYEFPYDEQGKERPQPVVQRPSLTLYVEYEGQKIPLARYGTTVGGWRSEMVDGTEMWKYKSSPVGARVWKQIVAAPVWLPPPGTTARTLLTRGQSKTGYVLNLHEVGPSYASAYGLVAAYHSRFREGNDGEVELQGDEGIRTHGSVDYMSIMQRHSHGCHRLHNHIAVRLMSFVLAHRAHQRVGEKYVGYRNLVEQDGEEYPLNIDKSGYVFALDQPLPVEVLKGQIRGSQQTPITNAIPKYDPVLAAYVTPDGGAVTVDRRGEMVPTEMPPQVQAPSDADAGLTPPSPGIGP